MNRSLIVARMAPGSERSVAAIFARSDATDLPHQLGVRERALFTFEDLYFHLIDFDRAPEQAMRVATHLTGFRAVSDELTAHITAYDPNTWRSPQDALARCFYHWSGPRADSQAATAARAGAPVGP